MKPEELYQKEFGDADSIPKESVIRLFRHFAKVLEIERNAVNQEVEKRIKERMPSEEEIMRRVRNRKDYLRELGYPTQVLVKYGDAIIETIEWLRSRLTNGSQKTECDYYESEGKCLPGCMTDSCKHHPNNQ